MDLSQALEIVSRTDPGMVRSHNEDSIATDATVGLVVLADGMGGYNAGEVASGMADDDARHTSWKQHLCQRRRADTDARQAWRVKMLQSKWPRPIARSTRRRRASRSMPGWARRWWWRSVPRQPGHRSRHIGDSRLYRYRGGEQPVRADHARPFAAAGADRQRHDHAGAGATFAEQESGDARAGHRPEVEAEIHEHEVMPGDIYLLCSDGLNDMVSDEDIELTLRALGANLNWRAAAGADGQRQRRPRQRFGDPGRDFA